jgi:hypothetical protein
MPALRWQFRNPSPTPAAAYSPSGSARPKSTVHVEGPIETHRQSFRSASVRISGHRRIAGRLGLWPLARSKRKEREPQGAQIKAVTQGRPPVSKEQFFTITISEAELILLVSALHYLEKRLIFLANMESNQGREKEAIARLESASSTVELSEKIQAVRAKWRTR